MKRNWKSYLALILTFLMVFSLNINVFAAEKATYGKAPKETSAANTQLNANLPNTTKWVKVEGLTATEGQYEFTFDPAGKNPNVPASWETVTELWFNTKNGKDDEHSGTYIDAGSIKAGDTVTIGGFDVTWTIEEGLWHFVLVQLHQQGGALSHFAFTTKDSTPVEDTYSLKVEKVVKDVEGNVIDDPTNTEYTKTFDVVLKVKGNDGFVKYTGSYTMEDKNGSTSKAQVSADNYLIFKGLPAGEYTVDETSGTKADYDVEVVPTSAAIGKDIVMPTLVITNTKKPESNEEFGSLKITKAVVDKNGNDVTYDASKKFEVSLEVKEGDNFVLYTGEYTLSDEKDTNPTELKVSADNYLIISDLPVGTYRVKEVGVEGYISSLPVDGEEVVIENDLQSTVDIKNQTSTLTIAKVLRSFESENLPTFKFDVYKDKGLETEELAYNNLEVAVNSSKTVPLAEGNYTVIEVATPGYRNVHITNNGLVTISDDSTDVVEITAYNEKLAAVEITKELTNVNSSSKTFYVEIDSIENHANVVTKDEFPMTVELKAGKQETIYLPEGLYTVKEINIPDGYSFVSMIVNHVKYTKNEAQNFEVGYVWTESNASPAPVWTVEIVVNNKSDRNPPPPPHHTSEPTPTATPSEPPVTVMSTPEAPPLAPPPVVKPVEPTPTPVEEIVEEVPAGPAKLPKTGGAAPIFFYGFGAVVAGLGLMIGKRK